MLAWRRLIPPWLACCCTASDLTLTLAAVHNQAASQLGATMLLELDQVHALPCRTSGAPR